MLIMKDSETTEALEAKLLSARIIAQIKALLVQLPSRSIEASRLTRLNWRVEATAKVIVTQGESLSGEVGQLQAGFILRVGDPMLPQLGLPEQLAAEINTLASLADQILSNLDEVN